MVKYCGFLKLRKWTSRDTLENISYDLLHYLHTHATDPCNILLGAVPNPNLVKFLKPIAVTGVSHIPSNSHTPNLSSLVTAIASAVTSSEMTSSPSSVHPLPLSSPAPFRSDDSSVDFFSSSFSPLSSHASFSISTQASSLLEVSSALSSSSSFSSSSTLVSRQSFPAPNPRPQFTHTSSFPNLIANIDSIQGSVSPSSSSSSFSSSSPNTSLSSSSPSLLPYCTREHVVYGQMMERIWRWSGFLAMGEGERVAKEICTVAARYRLQQTHLRSGDLVAVIVDSIPLPYRFLSSLSLPLSLSLSPLLSSSLLFLLQSSRAHSLLLSPAFEFVFQNRKLSSYVIGRLAVCVDKQHPPSLVEVSLSSLPLSSCFAILL
jgi:hypothetical protein